MKRIIIAIIAALFGFGVAETVQPGKVEAAYNCNAWVDGFRQTAYASCSGSGKWRVHAKCFNGTIVSGNWAGSFNSGLSIVKCYSGVSFAWYSVIP